MRQINLSLLARYFQAFKTCKEELKQQWRDSVENILEELPSGSGFDRGIDFDFDKSTPVKLVFKFWFHHMNSNGYYTGWSNHRLIITPTFGGYDFRITGEKSKEFKIHLDDLFSGIFTTQESAEINS